MPEDFVETRTKLEPFATLEGVKGIQTRMYTTPRGEDFEKPLVIGLRAKVDEEGFLAGLVLYVEKGGITGYESFNIDKYVHWSSMIRHGWACCAGTEGRYDRLVIPGPEMKRIHDWAAGIFNSLEV